MCLMMGPDQMRPQFNAGAKSKTFRTVMLGCTVVHAILAIMLMCTGGQDAVWNGINEMILVVYVGCAAMRMDFCCMFMYLICIIFPMVRDISKLGLLMQNHLYTYSWRVDSYTTFVISALTLYYIVANVLGFMAYREWKYELHTQKCGCNGNPGDNLNAGGIID